VRFRRAENPDFLVYRNRSLARPAYCARL